MKYIKRFENINISKYIIVTMKEWEGDIYILEADYIKDEYLYYNRFFVFEKDKIKCSPEDSGNVYFFKLLNILYQTDDLEDAKEMLIKLTPIYKNANKYNL